MNTLFRRYNILFCLLSIFSISMHAQVCRNNVVNLDANGHYTLKAEDVVQPFYLTQGHIFLYPTEFSCDDIGNKAVQVLIYQTATEYIECTATVTVRDVRPPVAKCFSNLNVVLDGQGQHVFTIQPINRQSTDECSVVGIRFFPYRITCSDPNPVNVLVVATDAVGNLDTCTMIVTWQEFPGPTQDMMCKDSVVFKLDYDEQVLLTPDLVFQDIPFGCPGDYNLALYDGGNLRPQPLITGVDSNGMFTAVVTDPGNGNQCTVDIIMKTNYLCDKPNLICDVQCHNAPFGDCASGHTLDDNVEWPCDIMISGVCPYEPLNLDPEFLIWYGHADSADASPSTSFKCMFTGFYDNEVDSPVQKIIERNWTVLDWPSAIAYEYVQLITLEYDLTDICDTLPWNAPAGNCDSGHTLSDDVEWPADITIHAAFSKPEDLEKNSEVVPQNVRPQVSTDCSKAEATYEDVVTLINDTTLLTERTWVVQDLQSQQEWEYVQHITIIRKASTSIVCVSREHGQAIPGVELTTGAYTDVKGCYSFENPNGIVVTPVKDSPLRYGVNVQDQIAIREYLQGHRTLSEYERHAADVTQNGAVNEEDILAIDEIIAGTFIPPFTHNWKFFEVATKNSFADISNPLSPYYFIGVKIGDVVTTDGEEEIFLHTNDEVLNAGETYDIPFYIDRDERISALGLQFDSPGDKVEFLSVTAPQLPEFSEFSYNVLQGSKLLIVWLANPPFFSTGAPIDEDEPFLIVRLKANQNIILHEGIEIGTNLSPEFILPAPFPAYIIRLHWENGIVLSTVDIGNGRSLEFYPNPVENEMHVSGLTNEDDGLVIFFNTLGQIALRTSLQETLDVSSLHSGLYYVSVLLDGVNSKAVPVVKLQ